MKSRTIALITALLSTPGVAQTVERRLDAAVEDAISEDFFGSVSIERDGRVLLQRSYGQKLAEQPIDSRTLFDVGSIAKQFTAAAVLLLEHRGKLSTDDALHRYIKMPPDKRSITIHHLLTHTAGFPRMLRLSEAAQTSRKLALQHIRGLELIREPGMAWEYSNVGYHLLAILIERVTHRPFEAFLRRELFRPARMQDTGFVGDDHLDTSRAAPRWEGHRSREHPDTAVNWAWHWGFRGAAGVVTTVEDLRRWLRVLDQRSTLPEPVLEKFFAPRDGKTTPGWEFEVTTRGTRRYSHSGRCYGFRCLIVWYPDEAASLIVLGNLDVRLASLDVDVEPVLFGLEPPTELMDRIVGTYELPDGGAFECFARDGRLVVRPRGVDAVSRVLHGERAGDKFNRPAFARRALATFEDAARDHDDFAACVAAHGRCKSIELLGTDPKLGRSWIRTEFGERTVAWRVDWTSKRTLASLARDDDYPIEATARWQRGARFVLDARDRLERVALEFRTTRDGIELLWHDTTELVCRRSD